MSAYVKRSRRQTPTDRFPTMLSADGATLREAIAGCKATGEECVLWVHEHDAARWDLPRRPSEEFAYLIGARIYGGHGWMVIPGATRPFHPTVHVAVVGWLEDFAGTPSADALGVEVEAWREAVGMAYLFSAADTIHKLVRSYNHDLGASEPEPELDGWAPTALASPASTWALPADDFAAVCGSRPWVRCYDRSGSYLAAWGGLRLPAGPWLDYPAGVATAGPETARPVGYWLVDQAYLPTLPLFDPWHRQGIDNDRALHHRVWLTTPLLQLAVDNSPAGIPYLRASVAQTAKNSLTGPSARLKSARAALVDGANQQALDALKVGYAAATAWFEYGPTPPKPLARPYWRRAILDRYTANTYRNLTGCTPAPVALCDIDTAIFPLEVADQQPANLRLGLELGAWKPKGPPIPSAVALDTYLTGGPRALVALAEGR